MSQVAPSLSVPVSVSTVPDAVTGGAPAATTATMSAITAWRALTPNIGDLRFQHANARRAEITAFARGGGVTKTIVPLVRDRLRQVQARHPVLVRRVDMDDLRQPRLLEQARRDAGPVPHSAVHGHWRVLRQVARVMRHVGHVHVHRAGDVAGAPL